jgi:small subunit ribosomal protein S20
LPNIKSAKKRVKVIETKTFQNKNVKSALKTDVKKFNTAVSEKSDDVNALFIKAVSAVDKAASKGVVHKNKANRTKAQLAKKLSSPAQ